MRGRGRRREREGRGRKGDGFDGAIQIDHFRVAIPARALSPAVESLRWRFYLNYYMTEIIVRRRKEMREGWRRRKEMREGVEEEERNERGGGGGERRREEERKGLRAY
jgi:hypothetical protein